MKRFNLLSLSCVFALSLLAGCSDSSTPEVGGAMMNDGAMMSDDMKGDAMMKDDGMMKGGAMMKEEGK